jgi:hypothetical protein
MAGPLRAVLCCLVPQIGAGNIYTVIFPFPAVNEGAEMIGGQEKGKSETDNGKGDKNCGVKVGFGNPLDHPQGKDKDIDGTDAVQHTEKKQDLRHVGLLFPKFKELSHDDLLKNPLSR